MHSIARRVLGLVLTEHQPWMTGIGNVDLHGFAVRPFGRRFHALDAVRRERFVLLALRHADLPGPKKIDDGYPT